MVFRNDILQFFGMYEGQLSLEKRREFRHLRPIEDPARLMRDVKQAITGLARGEHADRVLLSENVAAQFKDALQRSFIARAIAAKRFFNQQLDAVSGPSQRFKQVCMDKFVLVRKANRPEMIFNLDSSHDAFFQVDAQ